MREVSLEQAAPQLVHLVEEALGGEEIVIARGGTPLVRLVPVEARQGKRVLGIDAGKIIIRDDFDEPMPELERLFYGDGDSA